MSTYNGQRFIAEQVESIIAQLGPDDELVVGDDQSTDETIAYLRSLHDPRIKIHINPIRLRHVRNFEACMQRACGDIIVFSDQDDIWMPNKLAWTRSVFAAHPEVTLAHHGMQLVGQDRQKLDRTYTPQRTGIQPGWLFLARQLVKGEIFGSASAVRSSALRFLLPFPAGVYAHDHWFAIANAVCGRVFLGNELLMHYRQHDSNLTPKTRSGFGKRLGWRVALARQTLVAIQRRIIGRA